jgi:hypothetical protein
MAPANGPSDRGATRYPVSIWPSPFTSIVPSRRRRTPPSTSSYVERVIWISPGVLWAPIRLAVLTASPQRSYRKRFEPITPAMTGPELMPVVESKRLRDREPHADAEGVTGVHSRATVRPSLRDLSLDSAADPASWWALEDWDHRGTHLDEASQRGLDT